MQPTTRTEELDGAPAPASADAQTAEHIVSADRRASAGDAVATRDGVAAAGGANTPVRPALVTAVGEQCAACGAAMASDQRYCVECGQRRGSARVPLLDGFAQRGREPSLPASRPRRPRVSVNNTLIAGVGTLLLAIGVGVLIGRSANNTSAKAPPAQVVTVAGGGSAGTSAATPSTSAQPSAPSASKATKSPGASAAAKAKVPAKGPPVKTVTVGTPGKGPGYQKGHFTGNFFGPEAEGK
jgi:hypothetical protein